jgi:uroporphyrinogen III methyltransferase/synthase
MSTKKVGTVFLVGAGPGDPGLITLRGVECLKRADVILYDYLVNPRILAHAPRSAEQICLGQHGRSRIWSQTEINDRLVALALEGNTVVRLKGGDPGVFAREVEEIAALAQAGIPFTIVPGITAGLAAASYVGIPLTHREHASAVAFVTGQEDEEKGTEPLDYSALARFPGTLVFYMGITTVQNWSQRLMDAGKLPTTPVAIVRRCTLPDQQVIRCTLANLAKQIEGPPRLRPPAICIVGAVAGLCEASSWFDSRPLFGRRILVTRPLEQSLKIGAMLEELGADILVQPVIEIAPPADLSAVDNALANLSTYDWIVFSSANGVIHFLNRLMEQGQDARALKNAKLAVIGPGTSEQLATYYLQTDLIPPDFQAESLADALATEARGKSFLLVRASRGREVLAQRLRAAAGHVEQIVVYDSKDVLVPHEQFVNQMHAGTIDWVTITSSAIAQSTVRLFGDRLRNTKLVSISPITTATLCELGFSPAAEAEQYTMEGVVQAILRYEETLRPI